MQNNHDAAGPLEIYMHHIKLDVTKAGQRIVAGIGVGIPEAQHLVSADRFAICVDAGNAETAKADLVERRLARLESELGLTPLGGH